MPKQSSSVSYMKIVFLTIFIFTVMVIGSFSAQKYFSDITQNVQTREISNSEKNAFAKAIQTNDEHYFSSLTDTSSQKKLIQELQKFTHKLDITIETKNEYLFFSFLGLKPNSSFLHTVYGSYSKKNTHLILFPNLHVAIHDFNKNQLTLTITNTSDTILPADKDLILMPQNITITSEHKTVLLPHESKQYFLTKEINDTKHITFLESVKYGYKAKVIQ